MWSDHDFGIDRDNSQFGRIIQHLTDGAEDPTVASPSSTSSPPCQTDTAATLPDVKQLLNKSENYKTGLQSAQLRSKLIACRADSTVAGLTTIWES